MNRITEVVKNLIIINVIVYFSIRYFLSNFDLTHFFVLFGKNRDEFSPYQLFTYMFMHGSETHLLFNMMALFFLGPMVESVLGPKRFLFLYISAGLAGGLAAYFMTPDASSVGASAAINGVVVAFALMFPNVKLMVFPIPFEIKAIYLATAFILYDTFAGFSHLNTGIGHFSHLGGAIVGAILTINWGLSRLR